MAEYVPTRLHDEGEQVIRQAVKLGLLLNANPALTKYTAEQLIDAVIVAFDEADPDDMVALMAAATNYLADFHGGM